MNTSEAITAFESAQDVYTPEGDAVTIMYLSRMDHRVYATVTGERHHEELYDIFSLETGADS